MADHDSPRRLIPEPEFAKSKGVTVRTTYEWERRGILPPAIRIRGRKYRYADTLPRFDDAADHAA